MLGEVLTYLSLGLPPLNPHQVAYVGAISCKGARAPRLFLGPRMALLLELLDGYAGLVFTIIKLQFFLCAYLYVCYTVSSRK